MIRPKGFSNRDTASMLAAVLFTTLLCPLGDLLYCGTQSLIHVCFSLFADEMVGNSTCSTPDHCTAGPSQCRSQVAEENVILKRKQTISINI